MANEQDFPLPPELDGLSAFVDSRIESFAGPSSELHTITLCATKYLFDWAVKTELSSKPHLEALLSTLTETAPPQTRSQAHSSSKRKRSPSPVHHKAPLKFVIQGTPLPSLFIDGMNGAQIWQQLDLRSARVCEHLQTLQGDDEDANLEGEDSDSDETVEGIDAEAEDMDVDCGEWKEEQDNDDEDDDDDDDKEEEEEEEEDGSSAEGGEEGVVDLREEASEDEDSPASMLDIVSGKRKMKSHSQGQSELDDGFFNLATFNAETIGAEVKQVSPREQEFASDEDSWEETEVDFFDPVNDFESDGLDGGGEELFYKDFFDPPRLLKNRNHVRPSSSKVRFHDQVAVKKIKAVGKGKPVSSMDEDDSDSDEEDDEGS